MPDNKQPDPAQSGEADANNAQENPIVAAKNNPCLTCRANLIPPPCTGHAGQSTDAGSTGEEAGKSDNKASANLQGPLIDTMCQVVDNVATQAFNDKDFAHQQSPLTEKIFNPEIISDLLSKKFLFIDNDQDSGILIIKLQCKPNLLSEEQRNELKNFIDSILKALEEFKKEKDISDDCATIVKDNEGNFLSLQITLSTPKIYDAFIQRLASKNLLPIQNIEQKEKVVYEENMNHFNPTPLSMKPAPLINKGVKSEEEEKQAAMEEGKSYFNRP